MRRMVIQDHMHLNAFRNCSIRGVQELQELLAPVRGQAAPMTVPVSTCSAANHVVVPLRL